MNYKRIYENLINRARTRVPPEGYIERHHVVPRCLGGSDDETNLVALTPEEHYVAHQLLVKMYPKERGLIYAANNMTANHNGRKNKRYGWIKRKFSKQRAIDSKGKGNTQYGTMWINKVGTTENKKIPKGDPIPKGWKKGRCLYIELGCVVCGSLDKPKSSKYCKQSSCQEIKAKSNKIGSLVYKTNQRKKRELLKNKIKKFMLENGTDVNEAMRQFGYKVPQYGNGRYLFEECVKELKRVKC